jgi:ferredoxin
MPDVDIKLEREGLEGIIPVGTYLADAMRRIGAREVEVCDIASKEHGCVVEVKSGRDLLSPLTAIESEHLDAERQNSGDRLACQAKIERPGEIVVMTKEKKKEEAESTETNSEEYRKEFTEMPLEKKIADLMRLEAITLGETFSFIVNSPFKIFEKVGDVMAEFGLKLEKEAKKAQRPPEHTNGEAAENGSSANSKNGEDKNKETK